MGPSPDVTRVFVARALTSYIAILLPIHLSRLGYDAFAVGLISTATLLAARGALPRRVLAGFLKAAYDLTLLGQFSGIKPPEERREHPTPGHRPNQ